MLQRPIVRFGPTPSDVSLRHGVSAPPSALRTLMEGVVDYAGLFPPASLAMHAAVVNYAGYRAADDAWMLGRFVLPVSRLSEWRSTVASIAADARQAWRGARLSGLLSGEFAQEAGTIDAFNAASPFGVRVDAAEGRALTPDSVLAMAAALPDDVQLYCELPLREDPEALLAAVRAAGVRAKIRTGGVTADAFPSAQEIVRFLRRCAQAGVTAKATAGLHHPLRGDYPLTYAHDAPRGMMYGYLNMILCAAAIRVGESDDAATAILQTTDSASITIEEDCVRVAGTVIPGAALRLVRAEGVVAFGSCSFREPVDELDSLLDSVSRTPRGD
jgi:hypothetical protein